jgi:hypothetical protein
MLNEISPDAQKAKALKRMADITLKRLSTTEVLAFPSNTLNDYYDILHKLMEAIALLDGIKISGEGAHQELIDYVCRSNKLGQRRTEFLQQLRIYRNRIAYEGFIVDKDYIERNEKRITELHELLSDIIYGRFRMG